MGNIYHAYSSHGMLCMLDRTAILYHDLECMNSASFMVFQLSISIYMISAESVLVVQLRQ